jgi:pimeloyl-ACP methyl ester carboxylesterase
MTSFEQLEFQHGPLRFSALAAGSGPVVLCLHGFPDNARSYRLQLPVLAEAGYRAVSVHLRGYEPSSIPADGDYSDAAIADDVVAIIDQLDEEQVHLIGHDWGAIKSYVAAAQAPDRFRSLSTLSIPHPGRLMLELHRHPKQIALFWYIYFFQLRGIADYALRRKDFNFVRMLWRRWSPNWTPPGEELAEVISGLRQPGVAHATLGYYRELMKLSGLPLTPTARKKADFKVPVPTMALTGENDGCFHSKAFQAVMQEEDFPAGLVVHEIANAGHFPHQEQPEAVNSMLLDWIGQHEVRKRGAYPITRGNKE